MTIVCLSLSTAALPGTMPLYSRTDRQALARLTPWAPAVTWLEAKKRSRASRQESSGEPLLAQSPQCSTPTVFLKKKIGSRTMSG